MKADLLCRCLLGALLLWLLPAASRAQELSLLRSLPLPHSQAVSIDRLGQVYVADQQHNLHKFSPQGELLFTYSPAQPGRLTTVEAWNPVQALLFYEDRQQLTWLDRFLTPITTLRLSDFSDGLVRLAALASDNQFWILNESHFTLQKVDPRYPDARAQAPLNQVLPNASYDFRLLREYQNNLYLLDRNSGIYLFDNMGNYKKKLPVAGLTYLGFIGDEGYYLKAGKLIFFNLYTLQEKAWTLPAAKTYQLALVGEQNLYLFSGTHLDIYRRGQ